MWWGLGGGERDVGGEEGRREIMVVISACPPGKRLLKKLVLQVRMTLNSVKDVVAIMQRFAIRLLHPQPSQEFVCLSVAQNFSLALWLSRTRPGLHKAYYCLSVYC